MFGCLEIHNEDVLSKINDIDSISIAHISFLCLLLLVCIFVPCVRVEISSDFMSLLLFDSSALSFLLTSALALIQKNSPDSLRSSFVSQPYCLVLQF